MHVEPIHYERELEPGVPMPVAADPTVPDPTSVAPSPEDSGNVTPVDIEASSRGSSVNGSVSSRGRSPSGLFTPLTAENSRPPTPKLRSSELGDAHYESPLKHVLTAEQMSGADEATGAPSAGVDDISGPLENVDDALPSAQVLTENAETPTEVLDESQPGIDSVETTELDELNLEYPSDTEEPATASTGDNQQVGLDKNADPDANGDAVPVNGEVVTESVGTSNAEDVSGVASGEPKNGVSVDDVPEQDSQDKLNGEASYVVLLLPWAWC